ncbi:hypothetical protein PISMIDRAFT_671794 [Pisolithus microcarpus 441]|uniref:Uncharacterized protein n=1 Tax=Pisolithus microcarpus 441 TaxID=765257 RepID=A0A0C9ZUY4_9AGAM|nr:hypothetical protein PISMIDRAFT_671794 [Pisolithus microcarpus 441]
MHGNSHLGNILARCNRTMRFCIEPSREWYASLYKANLTHGMWINIIPPQASCILAETSTLRRKGVNE